MKKIIAIVLLIFIVITMVSCVGEGVTNVDVGKIAIISLPNGEFIEGEIESLTRYSSFVEVTVEGITYSVDPLRMVIIAKSEVTENEKG